MEELEDAAKLTIDENGMGNPKSMVIYPGWED